MIAIWIILTRVLITYSKLYTGEGQNGTPAGNKTILCYCGDSDKNGNWIINKRTEY